MSEEQKQKILTLASVDADKMAELARLYFEMYREMLRDALQDDPEISVVERLWQETEARAKNAGSSPEPENS